MITNCITEIPQDINIILNSDTRDITLKAGSKVYVPNGSGIFEEVIIQSDKTGGAGAVNQEIFVAYDFDTNNLITAYKGGTVTTDPTPSGNYYLYYNSTTNKCLFDTPNGLQQSSFPLGLIYCGSHIDGIDSNIDGINQVFNGFGYIGSTIFALPVVKCLIPAGFNGDGTLRNTLKTLTSVKTTTLQNDFNQNHIDVGITSNTDIDIQFLTYNKKENFNYNSLQQKVLESNVATLDVQNGRITSFTPKTVFHALDYNDKETVAGWSMPSSKYIDLTLGASDTTYTAPANGYFLFCKAAGDIEKYMNIVRVSDNFSVEANPNRASNWGRLILPVRKGDVVSVGYSVTGDTKYFRFYYAEGEV